MDYQAMAERVCRMNFAHMRDFYRLFQSVAAQGEDAILLCLYLANRPMFAGEFIGKLGLTTGRIANILKRLEAKALVARISDREDRRRVSVSLTEAGQRQAEQQYLQSVQKHRELLAYLGEADAQELIRILSRALEYSGRQKA